MQIPNRMLDDAVTMGFNQSRVEIEFYCAECRHYTYAKLNRHLNGNHLMRCPNCGHQHYRVVKNGVITSDRYDDYGPTADVIVAMKSACVPEAQRRKRPELAQLRELEAQGELKDNWG